MADCRTFPRTGLHAASSSVHALQSSHGRILAAAQVLDLMDLRSGSYPAAGGPRLRVDPPRRAPAGCERCSDVPRCPPLFESESLASEVGFESGVPLEIGREALE